MPRRHLISGTGRPGRRIGAHPLPVDMKPAGNKDRQIHHHSGVIQLRIAEQHFDQPVLLRVNQVIDRAQAYRGADAESLVDIGKSRRHRGRGRRCRGRRGRRGRGSRRRRSRRLRSRFRHCRGRNRRFGSSLRGRRRLRRGCRLRGRPFDDDGEVDGCQSAHLNRTGLLHRLPTNRKGYCVAGRLVRYRNGVIALDVDLTRSYGIAVDQGHDFHSLLPRLPVNGHRADKDLRRRPLIRPGGVGERRPESQDGQRQSRQNCDGETNPGNCRRLDSHSRLPVPIF